MHTQRTIQIDAADANVASGVVSSYQSSGFGFVGNLGMNIYIPVARTVDLFARIAGSALLGDQDSTQIQKAAGQYDSVKMNGLLLIPSVSIGVNF